MKRRKANQLEMLKRREEIAQRHLDGKTYRQIAEELSISIGTISNDLKVIEKEWQKEAQESIARQKAVQLAKIGLVEKLAHEAFEKSRGEQVVHSHRVKGKAGSANMDVIKTEVRRNSPGDPRFLQIIGECIAQKCRLLGLYASAGDSGYDHLPVIGFEVVLPNDDEDKRDEPIDN